MVSEKDGRRYWEDEESNGTQFLYFSMLLHYLGLLSNGSRQTKINTEHISAFRTPLSSSSPGDICRIPE